MLLVAHAVRGKKKPSTMKPLESSRQWVDNLFRFFTIFVYIERHFWIFYFLLWESACCSRACNVLMCVCVCVFSYNFFFHKNSRDIQRRILYGSDMLIIKRDIAVRPSHKWKIRKYHSWTIWQESMCKIVLLCLIFEQNPTILQFTPNFIPMYLIVLAPLLYAVEFGTFFFIVVDLFDGAQFSVHSKIKNKTHAQTHVDRGRGIESPVKTQ